MKEALLKMHLAVFLWGFTGVLGRAIELAAFPLVWYRVLLSALFFLVILIIRKELGPISLKKLLKLSYIGAIIAVHWCCFYGAIKYANASIALVCLATAGIFTAILEPIFNKTKFNPKEMFIGAIALLGMYFIYHFEFEYATGILLGILAAVLSSIFTILNKQVVDDQSPRVIAFYELLAGFIFLSVLYPVYNHYFPSVSFNPSSMDWVWLIVLSLFCTVWGQALALEALKKLSSFTTVLMVNLEPVYGILLAILIYKENKDLGWGFIIGILLIGGSVLIHSIQMLPKDNKLRKRFMFIRK